MLILQVIPCSLEKLLVLSDTVKVQNTKIDGKRVCQACGKRDEALMKCGRCNLCWYCNGVRKFQSFSQNILTKNRYVNKSDGTKRATKKIARF
jgi:hypothetical protein